MPDALRQRASHTPGPQARSIALSSGCGFAASTTSATMSSAWSSGAAAKPTACRLNWSRIARSCVSAFSGVIGRSTRNQNYNTIEGKKRPTLSSPATAPPAQLAALGQTHLLARPCPSGGARAPLRKRHSRRALPRRYEHSCWRAPRRRRSDADAAEGQRASGFADPACPRLSQEQRERRGSSTCVNSDRRVC
jgi:hypothetical protein